MQEEEEEEKYSVTLFLYIELENVERVISFASYCNTTRLFSIGTFIDN